MGNILKDARHSLRTLLRQPAFTVVAVITLALGIGANTAIFSLVNAVLLRALPFRSPEQLVSIGKSAGEGGLPGLAGYQYLAWKDQLVLLFVLCAWFLLVIQLAWATSKG